MWQGLHSLQSSKLQDLYTLLSNLQNKHDAAVAKEQTDVQKVSQLNELCPKCSKHSSLIFLQMLRHHQVSDSNKDICHTYALVQDIMEYKVRHTC